MSDHSLLTKIRVCNYIVAMKTALIKIGNSQGIRIPKPILEQCGLRDEVELEVQHGELIIRSARHPRQDWEQAFQRMAALGDDALLDPEVAASTTWDEVEWEWT
jgi:antitoxin MazE